MKKSKKYICLEFILIRFRIRQNDADPIRINNTGRQVISKELNNFLKLLVPTVMIIVRKGLVKKFQIQTKLHHTERQNILKTIRANVQP
jgi:hypothetical protein